MDSTTPPTILTTPTTNKKAKRLAQHLIFAKNNKGCHHPFPQREDGGTSFLSRQRKLHGESEVVGRGGVRAGREQWGIGLTVVVGRERQQA